MQQKEAPATKTDVVGAEGKSCKTHAGETAVQSNIDLFGCDILFVYFAPTGMLHYASRENTKVERLRNEWRKNGEAQEEMALLRGAPLPLDRDQCLSGCGLLQRWVT